MSYLFFYKFLYSFIPCFAYFLVIKYQKIDHQKGQWLRLFLLVIFLVYLYFVLAITGIDSIYLWHLPDFNGINLILFDTFGEISYLLNIFLFVPFGLLVPIIWKEYRHIGKTVLLGSCCSLLIELLQLFCGRVTDIDDFLMNTLGSILGYFIWKLCKYLFSSYLIDKEGNEVKEKMVGSGPIIWILLLLFGYLFLII